MKRPLKNKPAAKKQKRINWKKHKKFIISALTKKGWVLEDLAKKFKVKKQRIQQLAKDWGFKVKNRRPEWYACYLGHPSLAKKRWVKKQAKKAGSLTNFAKKLKINVGAVISQMERLDIDPHLYSYRAKRIKVRCLICKKKLERLAKLHRPKQKIFFCTKKCQGLWLAKKRFPNCRPWTKKEIIYLKKNYKKMTDKQLAEKLKRSSLTISQKRQSLKLRKRHKQHSD